MKKIFTTIIFLLSIYSFSEAKKLFEMDKLNVFYTSPASQFVCYYPNKMRSLSNDSLIINWKKKYLVPKPKGWDATFDFAYIFHNDTDTVGSFILPPNDYIVTVLQFYPNNIMGTVKSQVDFWVEGSEGDTTTVIFEYVATEPLSVENEGDESNLIKANIYSIEGILLDIPVEKINNLPKGVYFIEYVFDNKKVIKKVIN